MSDMCLIPKTWVLTARSGNDLRKTWLTSVVDICSKFCFWPGDFDAKAAVDAKIESCCFCARWIRRILSFRLVGLSVSHFQSSSFQRENRTLKTAVEKWDQVWQGKVISKDSKFNGLSDEVSFILIIFLRLPRLCYGNRVTLSNWRTDVRIKCLTWRTNFSNVLASYATLECNNKLRNVLQKCRKLLQITMDCVCWRQ